MVVRPIPKENVMPIIVVFLLEKPALAIILMPSSVIMANTLKPING
ncbi:hypothetical protein [Clostridium sp. UBA2485]|nr:hypothetical protein [Clostridium sp. UBA2485]